MKQRPNHAWTKRERRVWTWTSDHGVNILISGQFDFLVGTTTNRERISRWRRIHHSPVRSRHRLSARSWNLHWSAACTIGTTAAPPSHAFLPCRARPTDRSAVFSALIGTAGQHPDKPAPRSSYPLLLTSRPPRTLPPSMGSIRARMEFLVGTWHKKGHSRLGSIQVVEHHGGRTTTQTSIHATCFTCLASTSLMSV